MSRSRRRTQTVAVAAAAAALLAGAPAVASATGGHHSAEHHQGQHEFRSAPDLFVLGANRTLVRLDGGSWQPEHIVRVRGLDGDRLVALDVRPATGGLYALGRTGQLYTIDTHTGWVSRVGAPIALEGKAIGFDFNPTVDRIRVVTSAGENLRVVPTDATIAAVDGDLGYAVGDPAEGRSPRVTAVGYTDSMAGATTTALFGIDSARDTLVLQGSAPGTSPAVSPNSGTLMTVGDLGIDVGRMTGFDIAGGRLDLHRYDASDYTAVAAVTGSLWWGTQLVSVDLVDGSTSHLATLPGPIVGVAFAQS